MLAALFSGVLSGAGLGLIFMRGGTTGGTDLVANLIGRNFRHLSLGKLVLLVDLVVVLISAFVYRNYESPLYAIINIFVSSKPVSYTHLVGPMTIAMLMKNTIRAAKLQNEKR